MTGPSPAAYAAYLEACRDKITEHGWMVQGVFPTVDQPGQGYSYTVGLTAVGQPELWVATLDPTIATRLLNSVASRFLDGARFQPGDVLVLPDWSVRFKLRGPVVTDTVGVAHAVYPEESLLVWQVLWPDVDVVFPDEDGYDGARVPQELLPLVASGRPNLRVVE